MYINISFTYKLYSTTDNNMSTIRGIFQYNNIIIKGILYSFKLNHNNYNINIFYYPTRINYNVIITKF